MSGRRLSPLFPILVIGEHNMPYIVETNTTYTLSMGMKMFFGDSRAYSHFYFSNSEVRDETCYANSLEENEEKSCSVSLKSLDSFPMYLVAGTKALDAPDKYHDMTIAIHYWENMSDNTLPFIIGMSFYIAGREGDTLSVTCVCRNMGASGKMNIWLVDVLGGVILDAKENEPIDAKEDKQFTLKGTFTPSNQYAIWSVVTFNDNYVDYNQIAWKIQPLPQTPTPTPTTPTPTPTTPTPTVTPTPTMPTPPPSTPTPTTPTPTVTPTPTAPIPCKNYIECIFPRVKCGVVNPRYEWHVLFPRLYCIYMLMPPPAPTPTPTPIPTPLTPPPTPTPAIRRRRRI